MNLKSTIDNTLKALDPLVAEMSWEDAKVYGHWLAQTWFFVKESTRLLNLCGAHMPQSLESIHNRFIDHAKEEQGHADALLRDLRHLGFSIDAFHEDNETAAFYQVQYYLIQHRNPLDFFGYIVLLEGVAVHYGERICRRVQDAHGRKSGGFLQIHGAEDPEHLDKALEQLQAFSMGQQLSLIRNFHFSAGFYEKILVNCSQAATTASLQNVG